MRDVLLNVTTSLDGFIADKNGGIDWLLPPPQVVPADYLELIGRVDTLVMGRATYETSLGIDDGTSMFADRRVYVFTSRDDVAAHPGVAFIRTAPGEFVRRLKAEEGGTIWLYGGGQPASALADEGLLDEYLIVIQPVLLGDGIPLWRPPFSTVELELRFAREWGDGLVELRYRRQ